jgi:DNA-binding FrmR family transcriptional regulator
MRAAETVCSSLACGYPGGYPGEMHTVQHKRKLIGRVRRVRGQIEAVERALDDERGCAEVVRTIAAARGAIDALAAEVMCDHLDEHLAAPRVSGSARAAAAGELASVIRQFMR